LPVPPSCIFRLHLHPSCLTLLACLLACLPACLQVTWGVDLTEGRAADPWKNALLSEEVKQRIFDMHDSEG
jgi:hypothetical protein